MSLFQFIQWLDNTRISMSLREGDWSFASIETIHIIGLGVSVGVILSIDLRLLGKMMLRKRVSDVIEVLEPFAIWGFGVMFVSGALLFLSEPMKCYTTLAFRIKTV